MSEMENNEDLTSAPIDEVLSSLIKAFDKLGHHSDMLENLSRKVRIRVLGLRKLQEKHDEIRTKFRIERTVLEANYQELFQILYGKRYEIVNGYTDVIMGDISEEEAKKNQLGDEKAAEGVPNFWLTVLKNNDVLSEKITEYDEGALLYLQDIKCSKIEEGFKLEFLFDENPYFKNIILTKTYHMADEEDEGKVEKVIGTYIEWHPGKCLLLLALRKNCESFFTFFSPVIVPDSDEEIDEEDAEELENLLEEDYHIGITFRNKIVPSAVFWFTGEAIKKDEKDETKKEEGS